MTEYDDTLIDMSDVDDRLDDEETETSSSEIDERTPSTSDTKSSPHETSVKDFHNISNNVKSSNGNPILVVSSKYYFHNPRHQPRPHCISEDNASTEVCQILPDRTIQIDENSENIATDLNENFISTLNSATSVPVSTPPQPSSRELSDAEEDQDINFITANSSAVANLSEENCTESCSSVADEVTEPVTETSEYSTQFDESIREAEAELSHPENLRNSAGNDSENLKTSAPTEADTNTEDTDSNRSTEEVEEDKIDLNQSADSSVAEITKCPEPPIDFQLEVSVDLSEQLDKTEEPEEALESTLSICEVGENPVEAPKEAEATFAEEHEVEEDSVQKVISDLGTSLDNQSTEQLFLDSEEVTEVIEEFTIPATITRTLAEESSTTAIGPGLEVVASSEPELVSSNYCTDTTCERRPSQLEATPEDNMGENSRVQEKLRQFEDNKKDESDDTKGTFTGSTSSLSDIEKQRRRNLIFDEERFEETFLKCLICREVYNESDKLPKMLHCHHTFCMDCLYQMYRVEGEFRQSLTGVFRHGMPMTVKIQCPTCREGIIISESELRRLPNDHTIMELLCFVNQTGKNDVQYCTKHQMQPLNFFCEPCIMPVCCDCTVIDHKESKGHIVVNVDEAMKKYTPIVEQTLADIRQEKTNIVEKRAALEAAQDDLDRIQKDLARQVRSVFDSIREILDEREKELYDASEAEIERKRETLEGHIKTLGERDATLNTEFNELQKATDEKDISLIFTGHKSAREALAKKVYVPTNSTKGFSVTFQFSSRADSVIKQNIANLGDIIFQS